METKRRYSVDSLRKLTKELWDLMLEDGGKSIAEMLAMKKREDRRGRIKRLLGRAIRSSSMGVFGGKMYYWGGKVYEPIERPAFHSIMYDIMANKIEVPDADLVKLSDVYSDCCNIVYSKQLYVRNNIMIFKNGVLDVEEGKFYKRFDPRFVQMWAVDYDYVPGAHTFLWHQFINQVLPDTFWQDALQMFLGATFLDRKKVKIEHILILLGRGANGKSVIQSTVCGVLGEEYVSTNEIGRLCSRGNDGDMAVAEINGKRLNYCTEMEETDFFKKSARLKALVSGENVTARQLYGNPFKAMNIPLLMANANMLPVFNKKDEAMLRRIYVIPFNVTIPAEKQNKSLPDEMREEYSGILNWILEGRDKFIKNGYRLPTEASINTFVDPDAADYSTVLKFMSIRRYSPRIQGVEISPVIWILQTALYNDYVRWCKQNKLEAVGKTVFVHTLINTGYRRERKNKGLAFGMFGTHFEQWEKEAYEREKARNPKKEKPKLLYVDGKEYATSLRQLAEYCGVSYHLTRVRYSEGHFTEFTKGIGRNNAYEVKGCFEVFRRLHDVATDEERKLLRRLQADAKYKRTLFNLRMKNRGWPYRQYDNEHPQLDEGIIVVPDWMDDKDVIKMAKRDGYDVRGVVPARGAYSLGGRGCLNSRDEIPEQETTKKKKI